MATRAFRYHKGKLALHLLGSIAFIVISFVLIFKTHNLYSQVFFAFGGLFFGAVAVFLGALFYSIPHFGRKSTLVLSSGILAASIFIFSIVNSASSNDAGGAS